MVDKVKMQAVAGGGRICFRGDSRDPSEMFKRGFFSGRKSLNGNSGKIGTHP